MNFLRRGAFWLGMGLFCLVLAHAHAATSPIPLTSQEESILFNLNYMAPVDLSPKRVLVEVHVPPIPELASFTRRWPHVWLRVQAFYARMNIYLEQTPAGAAPGPLAPGKRLRLEVLTQKDWLARTFKAFNVAPPFQLRFLKVCENKYAFAHLPLSVVHFSYKRFQDCVLNHEHGSEAQQIVWLANLVIHELGHLFGLYHSYEFSNDPVQDILPDGKTPNFMSQHLTSPVDMGFVEFQKVMAHSYLSGGKVFRQFQYVEMDPLRHLELLKKYNNYREPGKQSTKKKKAKSKAFGDYTDDEEDDDDD